MWLFSSIPWPVGSSGDLRDDSLEILFRSFSSGDPCDQFWYGQGCPLLDAVHLAFPLPTKASPTLQDALMFFLERLLWRVTCLNHASFCFLTVAGRGSYGPTKKFLYSWTLPSKSFLLRLLLLAFHRHCELDSESDLMTFELPCMLVDQGPSQQSCKEEYKPWK